ncbi:MAG: citrate synthase family protein [Candidatus Promineifilaceae bacterium]
MVDQHTFSAEEAAAILGVSRETLYAYVSRGLIRSQPAGDGTRRHRYAAADVEAARQRREQQRNPAAAIEKALNWGAPVLESSIALIENGRLYYRGIDAASLALESSLEEVAGLLWTGQLTAEPFENAQLRWSEEIDWQGKLSPTGRFLAALPLAATDPAAYDLRPEGVMSSGARIMHLFAMLLSGGQPSTGGVAAALQEGWGLPPAASELLNAALVLCADHELNVSTFTARCIASAEATPYAVVEGGLAALQGIRHGGHMERVEALLREAGKPGEAAGLIAARLRRGDSLPGFGHPLYPNGDPRAQVLLQLAVKDCGQSEGARFAVGLSLAVAEAAENLLGLRPNVDFALVTLARALNLPPNSALGLFALGRTAGWIGHALEQYTAGTLIRPRARYVGQWPELIS